MQRALETPEKAAIHESMDFVISGVSLLRALARTLGAEQMNISFAKFIGSTFAGMPRPSITYYPVIAIFRLDAGRDYRTFDQYQLTSGDTALIYPVNRRHKSSIRAALLEHVIPACRAWVEECRARHQRAAGYYAMHDQTFGELVFGPHKITGICSTWRGQFLKKSPAVVSLRPRMTQSG